ncbi:U4/U6-U5 snRNP complex subunit LSM8 [Neurospora sp. IMI 360204]|uniref:LSM2-LSM8 complex subunit LSM8 n=1 Tax=Neurospora tetraspora TaxID=94610 RepID=A0AAE0JP62_9PEZI|nr:U4/U6-U5 snRNP complex subunit LSM8 [Neurospora sp. IMI 360204]KAK3354813.1 hypothetical protein B0H65DRAFT_25747 [Neurospora tetraspora]
MSAGLVNSYLNKKVCIITVDGRTLVGTLISVDMSTNVFLQRAVERVIRSPDDDEPSAEIELGTHMIRGDTVCLVGLVDEPLDASIDWTKVKGATIGTTKH